MYCTLKCRLKNIAAGEAVIIWHYIGKILKKLAKMLFPVYNILKEHDRRFIFHHGTNLHNTDKRSV